MVAIFCYSRLKELFLSWLSVDNSMEKTNLARNLFRHNYILSYFASSHSPKMNRCRITDYTAKDSIKNVFNFICNSYPLFFIIRNISTFTWDLQIVNVHCIFAHRLIMTLICLYFIDWFTYENNLCSCELKITKFLW